MSRNGHFSGDRYMRALEDLDPLRYEGRVAAW